MSGGRDEQAPHSEWERVGHPCSKERRKDDKIVPVM